jgi:hypothetical protein
MERQQLKWTRMPADYKITVTAKYWLVPSRPFDNYRTSTQSAIVHVSAPQSVILFGSIIGGVLAYFLFPQARSRLINSTIITKHYILKELFGIGLAMLLSATVTILLSRIAETQFLIRVSVNDFWGAIAIGFVATYIGTQIFGKLLPPQSNQVENVVAIRPATAEVRVGHTQQFTTEVSDPLNSVVTWRISPATAGSITATGLYTAPNVIPSPPVGTVVAISTTDPTKFGIANIMIIQ